MYHFTPFRCKCKLEPNIFRNIRPNRRENITDWALRHLREHYGDDRITKWDIFYYVYGVLHHPGYRAKFADNLKRELPRIPLAPALSAREAQRVSAPPGPVAHAPGSDQSAAANQSPKRKRGRDAAAAKMTPRSRFGLGSGRPREGASRYTRPVPSGTGLRPVEPQVENLCHKSTGFWAFADAGRELAELHIGYESLEPWPLEWVETPGEPLSYRVEKMRLSKDKKTLKVNDSLTLGGVPPEVFEYRLGNRSALEWVIDQYRVKEDQRTGIRSDPNNADDPEYIVRLVGQVVRVSVETVRIVGNLPEHYAPPATPES